MKGGGGGGEECGLRKRHKTLMMDPIAILSLALKQTLKMDGVYGPFDLLHFSCLCVT